MDMYLVFGGIYTDLSFKRFEDQAEFAGPFLEYADAYVEWKKRAWLNVDNARHRLEIKKLELLEDHESD